MPGFDFSNAVLKEWDSGLPDNQHLYLLDVVWEDREFVAHFSSQTDDDLDVVSVYEMTCQPMFCLLVEDEGKALSLWKRRDEAGPKAGIFIIDDSQWVRSFEAVEDLANVFDRKNVHYVVGCGNDFFHLISQHVPKVTRLGRLSGSFPDELAIAAVRRDWHALLT